jgi:hypothetical protein
MPEVWHSNYRKMKTCLLITFLPLIGHSFALAQRDKTLTDSLKDKVLTPIEMRSDFRYLRRALEETHPGLYRYHTREEMCHEMDSVEGLLKSDMPFYSYYRILAALTADIRCAHTGILPRRNMMGILASAKGFPYAAIYIDNHAYVTFNDAPDTIVKPGYEMLSINGLPIDSVSVILLRHLWSDGYIVTGKLRTLDDAYFAYYYYLFVDQPDHFSITCKAPTGEIVKVEEDAIGFEDLDKNSAANPVNAAMIKIYGPRSRLNRIKPWRLEFHKEQDAAVLTIRTFGKGKNANEAAEKMRDFLEKSFADIRKNKIDNLIIDLRYNPGGWDNTGEVLLTYLIDTPTYYYRRFHTVTDSSEFLQLSSVSKEELNNIKAELIPEKDGTYTVKEEYNHTLAIQHPQKDRFIGKVYFLINGGTGSSAGEFSAVAYSNRLGVFVGEETQANYTGGNGGEFIPLRLPLTRIFVNIPLLFYDNAVVPPTQVGRGTIPDYIIPINIKDLLLGTDTQLNFVYGLIGKSNQK